MKGMIKRLLCCVLSVAMLSSSAVFPGFAEEGDSAAPMETAETLPDAPEPAEEEIAELPVEDEPAEIPEDEPAAEEQTESPQSEELPAEPVGGSCGDNVLWSLSPDGALTITGTGELTYYSSYSKYPWYSYKNGITSVVFGEGVTTVPQYAFTYYYNLASASLPSTLKGIGAEAFEGTKLSSVTIPDAVTSVGNEAFYNCSAMTQASVGDSVPWLGSSCFARCSSLETVEIGSGMRSFTSNAFEGCSNLKSINVDPANSNYSSDEFGILHTADRKEIILAPARFEAEGYVIPAHVETIRASAFHSNQTITDLVIPATVKTVGSNSFAGSYIRSLSLNGEYVSDGAFSNCKSLTEVEIGPGTARFSGNVFEFCSYLKEIVIPATLTDPGYETFYNCTALKNVTLCEGLPELGSDMFWGCTALEEITIPSSVTRVSNGCFYGCTNLKRVDLPGGLTNIDSNAFYNCVNLAQIDLPDSVTGIAEYAFYFCSNLTALRLPASLKNIHQYAFYCCGLKAVDIPDGVTYIGRDAFAYTDIKSVVLPEGLDSLGDHAFYRCRQLRSVTLPESLTYISDGLFWDCEALSTVKLPEGITSIGSSAFRGCTALTRITVPENVTRVSNYAFSDCTNLKSVIFEGPAPTSFGAYGVVTGETTIYYFSSQSHTGWTTPTWKGYKTSAIMGGKSASFHDGDYYAMLAQRNFTFLQRRTNGTDGSVYAVTLTYGGDSVTAPNEADSISVAIIPGGEAEVSFSKKGMNTATISSLVFGTLNTVHLHPDSETAPFVQAVYARHNTGKADGQWCDLLHKGTTFYAGDLNLKTEFYVNVNWNGNAEGTIWLSQTSDASTGWQLENDFNPIENYSIKLKHGLPLYLVLKQGDEVVHSERLMASILQASVDLPVDLVPDISLGSASLDLFKGFDFGMKLPGDIKASLSVEDDGTVKALLGVTVSKGDPKDTTAIYDHVKKSMLEEMSPEKFSGLQKLLKQRGAILETPKASKFVVDAKVDVIGFLEGKLVPYGNGDWGLLFSEGAVALKLGGEVAYTYQTMSPAPAPIPFYVKASFEPSAQFTLPLYSNTETGYVQAGSILLDVGLPIKVGGGVGFDEILSLGIYGKGGAYLKGHLDQADAAIWLQAHFGAEASVFCFSADLKIAETDKLYLLGGPAQQNLYLKAVNMTDAKWMLQSRDYLNAPSLGDAELLDVSEENTGLTTGAVTESPVYAGTDVQTVALADGAVLAVWTEDDPNRDAANRTVLYFSYFDGTAWSEPAPVAQNDDGTADFAPILRVLDGTAYVAWQNASRAITAEDTLDTIPALMDISCMYFDSYWKEFNVIRNLSVGTEHYDSTFDLVLNGYNVEAIWVSNSADSVLAGDEATYSIHRKGFGRNDEMQTLAEGLYYVDALASDGETIWFTADTDGDSDTLEDRELFALNGTVVTRLTEDTVPDTNPAVVNGQLVWYADGVVRVGEQEIPVGSYTDRFRYLAADGMEAVLYTESDENRITTLYASFNDGSGWGAPMVLSGVGGGYISKFAPCFLSDGKLFVVAAERLVDENNMLSDGAYLRTFAITPYCDLVVTAVDYLAQSMVAGGTLDVTVDVANRGMSYVQMVDVTVYAGKEELQSGTYIADISSGGSEQLYLEIPLAEDPAAMGDLIITVDAVGFTDAVPEDNGMAMSLRLSDLSVEDAEARSDGETTTVTAFVVNRGQTDLMGITVELLGTDGESVLAAETVKAIPAGEGQFVTLTAQEGSEHLAILKIRSAADGLDPTQENIASNNVRTVIVDGPKEPVFNVLGSAAATENGAVAVMEIVNTTAEETVCSLAAAAYSADGQLLSIGYFTYTVPAGGRIPATMTLETDKGPVEVRIFVLDGDAVPMKEAAIFPLA